MSTNFKKEREQEKHKILDVSNFADLSKNILDQYLRADRLEVWIFGSLILIAVLLVAQNYSKENVHLPLFIIDEQGSVGLPPVASTSAILRSYAYLGEIELTFDDLLKMFLLVFITVMLLKVIFNLLVLSILRGVWNFLEMIVPVVTTPIQKLFGNLPRRYRETVWLAAPSPLKIVNKQGLLIYPQLRRRIPYLVRNFKFIRFSITVLEDQDHWRAGVFITSSDKSKDYVFHIYKDGGDPQLKTKITRRNFREGRHEDESDTNLLVTNTHNFYFEIRAEGRNTYALWINGQEIDRYKIPKENFEFIEVGAWADDRLYKIKFTNIEFFG